MDWCYRFREAGWQVVFFPGAECVHVGGASHGGRLYRENLRGHLRFLSKHRGPKEAERARRLLLVSLRLRGSCFAGSAAASTATAPRGSPRATWRSSSRPGRDLLYLRLAFATAVVLAPGWLFARTVGVRSVSATLAWSLVAVFAALAVTFAFGSTLTLTLVLLAVVVLAAGAVRIRRGWRPAEVGARPGMGALLGRGGRPAALGRRAVGQGDGLFHLARARKLLSLDALSLDRVSEFADGSLHPGYAFPLWHGFLALIAKVAGEDPERVVVHLPTILAPLAVVVAFEAGWALFRRTWAAGVAAGAQVAMICFAPGHGGAYVFLALPATASRQLLVPAALALALESVRSPSMGLVASTAAAGLALAVVHPTYAIFLWIPFVGFLATRALWERKDLRERRRSRSSRSSSRPRSSCSGSVRS